MTTSNKVSHPDCPRRGSGHSPHTFVGPFVDGVKMVGYCDGEEVHNFGSREQDDKTAVLRRETANALGFVRNQLHVRRNHPTYGVTKRSLTAALARAESLVVALMILDGVVNNFNTNGNPVNRYAKEHFNTDLNVLRDAVKEA